MINRYPIPLWDKYKQIYVPLSANGILIPCENNRRIVLHGCFGQAVAAVEGDIQGAKTSGNLIHFKFNDREGFVLPFTAPGFWAKGNLDENLYVTFTTAAQCYFICVYTSEI